eukprot:gnl/MRDRNA2_/MRDRNA2_101665_c0_seq1.p1 gnl/MRDRNA2_/MRDRNA2_101665_c0~~gnl/MRDRNA2_/MRDRNA2_101665_c0_seq1.p1  ORF type:complete len:251 (+),score=62.54 gnl/MRDRNA2_/MRDRNA2_101665_c0_seq1:57-755(+)
MAAAATGSRRGKLTGQKESLRNKLHTDVLTDAVEREIYKEEVQKVNTIFDIYDLDKSGFIEEAELPKLLEDYNMEMLGRKGPPQEEDVKALLNLCDENGDGKIGKDELVKSLGVWFAYMQHSPKIYEHMKKFDASGTGKINEGELRPVLVELNKGKPVPDEVIEWVWEQADVLKNGCLNNFELARAIAVWYAWTPESEPTNQTSMAALRRSVEAETMPEPQKKKQSSVCAVL